MGSELGRKIGITVLSLILVAVALTGYASYRNDQRLSALKDQFCNLELPPDSQRRQCIGQVGKISISADASNHCDYLVWMKVNSDASPAEMAEWMNGRSIIGTDGETEMVPEVFESHGEIAPSGSKYRYHVQVIDAGHPAGLDMGCHQTP